jgi:hypothetical protein
MCSTTFVETILFQMLLNVSVQQIKLLNSSTLQATLDQMTFIQIFVQLIFAQIRSIQIMYF